MSAFWCRECGENNKRLACPCCASIYNLSADDVELHADRVARHHGMANLGANFIAAGLAAAFVDASTVLDATRHLWLYVQISGKDDSRERVIERLSLHLGIPMRGEAGS